MDSKKSAAALTAAILLTGCASSSIHIGSTNSPSMSAGTLPPGGSSNTVAFHADLSLGAYLGWLLFGHLLAGYQSDYRDWRTGPMQRNAPPLAEDRNILEVDCRLPIVRPTANLRCK